MHNFVLTHGGGAGQRITDRCTTIVVQGAERRGDKTTREKKTRNLAHGRYVAFFMWVVHDSRFPMSL